MSSGRILVLSLPRLSLSKLRGGPSRLIFPREDPFPRESFGRKISRNGGEGGTRLARGNRRVCNRRRGRRVSPPALIAVYCDCCATTVFARPAVVAKGPGGRTKKPVPGRVGREIETESFQELGSLDDRAETLARLALRMAAWLAGNSAKPSQRPGGLRPPRDRRRRSRGRDSPACSRLSRSTSTIITATTAFVQLGPPGFPPAPPGRLCRAVNGTPRRLQPPRMRAPGENLQRRERELRNKISSLPREIAAGDAWQPICGYGKIRLQ